MHPFLSRHGPAITVILVLLALVFSSAPTFGSGHENEPLRRIDSDGGGSDISGHRPDLVLANPGARWVSGLNPFEMFMRYQCTGGLCVVGDGVPGNTRTVEVQYTVDGSDPTGADEDATLSSTDAELGLATFDGEIDLSSFADDLNNSAPFKFRVEVELTNSPGGECQSTCHDPEHTSGEDFYELLIDVSNPGFLLGDPANANARSTADDEWYLYSDGNMSNFLPSIVISAFDNQTGAPLDVGESMLWREGVGENKGDYDETPSGSHAVSFEYDYADGPDAESFRDDRITRLDVLFQDVAGNFIDTDEGSDNQGIWVVMDITRPDLEISEIDEDEGGSNLTNPPGTQLPVGAGTNVRVHVNATDIGANKDFEGENLSNPWMTPPELLTVEARLFDQNDTSFTTGWNDVPFNQTRDDDDDVGYFWSNLTIPQEWTSGVTRAEVRVTDPTGNVNQTVIPGNVSVDADLPIIRPQIPVSVDESTGFSAEEDVEFRVRAWHPGDTDAWGDPDTDRLGIETVRLHYRVGEDGAVRQLEMDEEDSEDVYAGFRDTFEDDDIVYFYFSAEAISGTTVNYPGPDDPHESLSGSQNDGRFLRLELDRDPPLIESAVDLPYVGGPGDHELSFNITDDGVGVDSTTAALHWRLEGQGAFEEVALTEQEIEDPDTDVSFDAFVGTVPRQSDGDVIEYYVVGEDLLGNEGRLGTPGSPRTTTVDLTPPTITITAPNSTDENRFNISWEGQDAASGVRDFSLQFRIDTGNWITVPDRQNTRLTEWDICAATNVEYGFRLSARDRVGNIRDFPEVADATTRVNAAESCAEPPEIFLNSPSDGAVLSGNAEISWSALSTVFGEEVTVRIEVDGRTVTQGLEREGEYTWNTARYDSETRDPLCFEDGDYPLSVTAVDPAGMEASQEIMVTLSNGRDSCDPEPRTGGIDPARFDARYLLVVLAFVGLAAVFAVGMARRW